MKRDRRERDDDDEEETVGLLEQPAASNESALPDPNSIEPGNEASVKPANAGALVIPVKPASLAPTPSGNLSSPGGKELAICRICLEEDSFSNLDTPCGCAGTQRHAHQACIQRWVEEKGHLKCEICGQEYKGNYTAPPPRPEPEASPMLPVFIVDPDNPTRITIRRGNDVQLLDDSLDNEYQRHPGMNFVFTACVFILFLVVLHHTMGVADNGDDTSDPSYWPSPPPPSTPDDETLADGFTFFMFWIFTKVLLIGIPLWTILRVAQRQAQHQQYEEMMRGALDANRRVVFRVHTVRGAEMVTPQGMHAV